MPIVRYLPPVGGAHATLCVCFMFVILNNEKIINSNKIATHAA